MDVITHYHMRDGGIKIGLKLTEIYHELLTPLEIETNKSEVLCKINNTKNLINVPGLAEKKVRFKDHFRLILSSYKTLDFNDLDKLSKTEIYRPSIILEDKIKLVYNNELVFTNTNNVFDYPDQTLYCRFDRSKIEEIISLENQLKTLPRVNIADSRFESGWD